MRFSFKLKYFLLFTLTFILFVPIGTLSHEGGHMVVAQTLGYDTQLHYGSMKWDQGKLLEMHKAFYAKYETEIRTDSPFPEKAAYQNFLQKWRADGFKITLGGPFQTLLTSIVGLFLLYLRRKKRKWNGFKITDWVAVFLSLFCLRTTFNVSYGIFRSLLNGKPLLSGRSDETHIATYLDLPPWTFSMIFGALGLAVFLYIVFVVVPRDKRLTFILAGLIGGISGYFLWLEMLGPILMP